MAYYAVIYSYSDDTARQDEVRPEHRAWLRGLAEQGTVVASGPLLETSPATALLVFRADDEQQLRELLNQDPFQREKLVAQSDVAQWNPVIGILAEA